MQNFYYFVEKTNLIYPLTTPLFCKNHLVALLKQVCWFAINCFDILAHKSVFLHNKKTRIYLVLKSE